MCISERLRQVCEAKNWKITDFADRAGIAYRTMQGYIGGEREPNAEGMTGIAKAGVNLNWLVSGEGKMFQSVMPKNTISKQEEKLKYVTILQMYYQNMRVMRSLKNLNLHFGQVIYAN